jgi:hypothetical protein
LTNFNVRQFFGVLLRQIHEPFMMKAIVVDILATNQGIVALFKINARPTPRRCPTADLRADIA